MEGPPIQPDYAAYPRYYGPGLTGPAPKRVRFEAITDAWLLIKSDLGAWVLGSMLLIAIEILCEIPVIVFGFGQAFSFAGRSPFAMQSDIIGITAATLVVSRLGTGLMSAGVLSMGVKKSRGVETSVGDLFRLNGMFFHVLLSEIMLLPAALFPLLAGFLPVVIMKNDPVGSLPYTWAGQLVGYLVMGIAYTFSTLVPMIIVDQRASAFQAFGISFRTVSRHFWAMFFLLFIVASISVLGYVACGIGALFTIPFFYATRAVVYNDFFRPDTSASSVVSDPNMMNPPTLGSA